MELIENKSELDPTAFKDRIIYKAVGKDARVVSGKMSVGFGDYSAEIGAMEPHRHAEETVFIVKAHNAFFRYGDRKDHLGERIALQEGMLIHFDEMEWHVFDCAENGYLSILFIYGQVDMIRPEEIEGK